MEDITNYRKDYFSSATTKKKKKKKRKRFLLHRVNNARVTICITGSLVSLITTFPCGKTTCFLRTTTGPPTEHRERTRNARNLARIPPSFLVSEAGIKPREGKKNLRSMGGVKQKRGRGEIEFGFGDDLDRLLRRLNS